MLFIGDDWAEAHHDIEIQDETGRRLVRGRLPEGLAGIGAMHALVADHLPGDAGTVRCGLRRLRRGWQTSTSPTRP